MPSRDPERVVFPTSFRCPPKTYRAVERLARAQGCSISFKIVQIIEDYLSKQPKVRNQAMPHELPAEGGEG